MVDPLDLAARRSAPAPAATGRPRRGGRAWVADVERAAPAQDAAHHRLGGAERAGHPGDLPPRHHRTRRRVVVDAVARGRRSAASTGPSGAGARRPAVAGDRLGPARAPSRCARCRAGASRSGPPDAIRPSRLAFTASGTSRPCRRASAAAARSAGGSAAVAEQPHRRRSGRRRTGAARRGSRHASRVSATWRPSSRCVFCDLELDLALPCGGGWASASASESASADGRRLRERRGRQQCAARARSAAPAVPRRGDGRPHGEQRRWRASS